ncbi:MAG: hypothetical protein WC766_05905 [Patescibacteria group bacterium]|jgi:hypothetical protein
MSIADQFEKKIQTGELATPIPRWVVILKHAALWTAFTLVAMFAAVSAGVFVWFILDPVNLTIDAGRSISLDRFLDVLPLLWAIVSFACALLAVWIFTKSPRGYRFRVAAVLVICFFAIASLGVAAASSGIANRVEEMASRFVPEYSLMARPRILKMMNPGMGMIVGRIESFGTSTLELSDPEGFFWTFSINPQDMPQMIRSMQPGACVRIVGDVSSTSRTGEVEILRPCPRGVRLHPPVMPPVMPLFNR